jgi:hypothetical protein
MFRKSLWLIGATGADPPKLGRGCAPCPKDNLGGGGGGGAFLAIGGAGGAFPAAGGPGGIFPGTAGVALTGTDRGGIGGGAAFGGARGFSGTWGRSGSPSLERLEGTSTVNLAVGVSQEGSGVDPDGSDVTTTVTFGTERFKFNYKDISYEVCETYIGSQRS